MAKPESPDQPKSDKLSGRRSAAHGDYRHSKEQEPSLFRKLKKVLAEGKRKNSGDTRQ